MRIWDRRIVWNIIVIPLLCIGLSEAFLSHGTGGQSPPVDPGIRGGSAGAGGYLSGLSQSELDFAAAGQDRFNQQWSVSGTISGAPTPGLGARFNAWGCGSCHAYPAAGGSSPVVNNEYIQATQWGATNKMPSFITANGPTRIPYLNQNFGGYTTGTALKLYTITGRIDATGCTLAQPDYPSLVANNALSYHIPVPLYGIGLVEATPSSNLIASQNTSRNAALGITSGRFNGSADGVAHSGWKGAASSVAYFSALALSVDLGTTSEIFPRKPDETTGCIFNNLPEDGPQLARRTPNSASASADYASDVTTTSTFAKFLAPPTPACTPVQGSSRICYGSVTQGSVYNGQQKFIQAGCDACHIQQQTTGPSHMTGQTNVTYSPLSDFAIHNMGTGLADGLTQGAAGPEDFRTPPLWGIGQRIFLVHDGRTSDLYQAILDHSSVGSEANTTVANFNVLSVSDQQDILNYLRSL